MKKIYVIVDVQHDFVDGSLGTPEAKVIVPKILEKIRNSGEDDCFVFTADTHDIDYLGTPEGKKLPVEHCIKGTTGWEIMDELKAEFEGCPFVIQKPTFGSVELMEILDDMADFEDEIEFCGLCTDICVVSNVLMAKAYFPDMKISVDAECCAGVTPMSHKYAIETMKMCQIDVYNG